jgi:hypothetical protein
MISPRISLAAPLDERHELDILRALCRDAKLVNKELHSLMYSHEDLQGALEVIVSATGRMEAAATHIVGGLDDATLRAAAIAHALRLGRHPAPGLVIDFTLCVEQIEEEDFATGRLDLATPVSEKVRYEFTITQEDIDAGIRLINEEAAVYREPKLTTVKVEL